MKQNTVKTFAPDSFAEKLARKLFGVEKTEYRDLKIKAIMWANREYEALRARIAELEAAQQWHPASEPPPEDKDRLSSRVLAKSGSRFFDAVYDFESECYVLSYDLDTAINCYHWRDLPPLPEVES